MSDEFNLIEHAKAQRDAAVKTTEKYSPPGDPDDPYKGLAKPDQSEYGAPPEPEPALQLPFKQTSLHPMDGKLPDINSGPNGLDNTVLHEKQPIYNKAPCEWHKAGQNNTHIILGRDRAAGIDGPEHLGYGARGHTRAGAIDIVAGLQGFDPGQGGYWKFNDESGKPLSTPKWINGVADKNFGSMNNDKPGDAARIYISQRADIDTYFDICPGGVGMSFGDSAIGMKADSVRIMSRKGIKLVTQKAPPGRDSKDGRLKVTYGIDLIAGNRDIKTGLEGLSKMNPEFGVFPAREINYLQPIPKGSNLVEYLAALHKNVQMLNNIMAGYLTIVPHLARAVLSPSFLLTPTSFGFTQPHMTPWVLGDVTSYLILVFKQYMKLYMTNLKMVAYEQDYLTPKGSLYVLSRYNRTN